MTERIKMSLRWHRPELEQADEPFCAWAEFECPITELENLSIEEFSKRYLYPALAAAKGWLKQPEGQIRAAVS